jgi:hypothetical protein
VLQLWYGIKRNIHRRIMRRPAIFGRFRAYTMRDVEFEVAPARGRCVSIAMSRWCVGAMT